MRKTMSLLATLLLALAAVLPTAFAQDAFEDAVFAAVNEAGDLIVYHEDGTITPIPTADNLGIVATAWSADGSTLAFVVYNSEFRSELWVAEPEIDNAFKLETGDLEAGFPITFTPDGDILYAQSGDFPADPETPYKTNLMTIAPEPAAQPQLLGSVHHGVGCGGGSPYPADWHYSGEAGFNGNTLTLQWTEYGILHTTSCGGLGLALLDPTRGEDRALTPEAFSTLTGPQEGYGRAVVSPDGQTVAAIRTVYSEQGPQHSLATIDLATGTVSEIATSKMPQHVAWGPEGTLFYSSREESENLLEGLSADELANVEAVIGSGFPLPAYHASITQLYLATGEETEIYSDYVYAIGRMAWTGEELYFSTVANMDQWAAGIADGSLDIMADADGSAQSALVPLVLQKIVPGEGGTSIGNFALFTLA